MISWNYSSQLLLLSVCGIFLAQIFNCQGQNRNIKLVAMNGNQYWFSSSSPYAPMLNFHLAYQYCRTLGLQLVTLETKEEVDLIASYLKTVEGNRKMSASLLRFPSADVIRIAGNVGKEFWTSGNKLGSEDSWIWMSSGEQLNATFSEYWLQQKHQGGSGAVGKHCMTMQAASNKRTIFSPEECGRPLTFICEQLRCLYYNYPVTPFPDPDAEAEIAALRADLDGSHSSPSESRSIPLVHEEDALRIQNYLLHIGKERSSELNLPYSIRRRINLRPSSAEINSNSSQPDDPTTTTTAPEHSSSTAPSATTTTINFGLLKSVGKGSSDLWTPPPSDLNFVTVKNVVVSKSEKVSYSSNYSNINGSPTFQSSHRAYQIRPAKPVDFIADIPVDSGVEYGSYRTSADGLEHEATETIFYDDVGHTDHYHLDDTTELSPDSHETTNTEPIALRMFQFHRSKTPVSWSTKA